MAKLIIRAGPHTGDALPLRGDRLMMGRRTQCAVPLTDPKASREHAILVERDHEYFLQDLSRNGTLLNGQPAAKGPEGSKLKFGDRIQIGDTVLEMVDEEAEPIRVDIPGYKIEQRIGSGGMGTVFKAKQLSMDRIVALKVLNERYSANTEFVDRFIREARAAGKLNHPNVIHVHDTARANGRHYFSMEYISGPSVKELLKKETRLNVNKALDIVIQAARALEFAHENRIIHRDIKPENIMLTKEGIVKLADLGIAKTFDEAPPSAKDSRRVMGTPHYMAPEQALGKALDHRVDIYSLGATFYHMVTGNTPFSGSTAQEILKAHVNATLPAVQDVNPDVPDPVCYIIERMMAKLPEKRYPNMTRLIEDLEQVQSGQVKGIERIDAGDSTIQRSVGQGRPTQQESATSDLTSSVQTATSKLIAPLALAVVFVVVVAAVVWLVPRRPAPPPEPLPAPVKVAQNPAPNPVVPEPPAPHGNPEAQKILDAALVALSANDFKGATEQLAQIRERYPASAQAEEAAKKLDEIAQMRLAHDRKRAETLLAEAQSFEAASPASVAESIAKYRAAVEAAAAFPPLLSEAKRGAERLEKQLASENAGVAAAALQEATAKANVARLVGDFDTARKAYQSLLDSTAATAPAAQKEQIQAALNKLNADAEARYKETTDSVAKLEAPAALSVWQRYTDTVKDAVHAADAKATLAGLEAKVEQGAQADFAKVADAVKKNHYADAVMLLHTVQRKLSGTRWGEQAKAGEESIRREKDLYEKVMAAAAERLAAGPLDIPFPIETRFGKIEWKLTRLRADQFDLDAVPLGKAPGLTKRLSDLAPAEQYQFCLLFLPKDLTPELHKALEDFCAARGLSPDGKAPPPPVVEKPPAPEPAKEAPKDAPKDAVKDAAGDAPKDAPKDPPKEPVGKLVKDVPP